MSIFSDDCIECGESPCVCGWAYRTWSMAKIDKQIEMLERVKKFHNSHSKLTISKYKKQVIL